MKTIMREDIKAINEQNAEKQKQFLSERNKEADRLCEAWSKRTSIVGSKNKFVEGYNKAQAKYRNLAILLENQERMFKRMTETQISNSFMNTAPENLLRLIRLGYPNSVRGDIFHEFATQTMKDSFFYLQPVYTTTARDATANAVTYETATNRYSTEFEIETVDGTGAGTNYTGTLTNVDGNIRPYKCTLMVDGIPVAYDNGASVFVAMAGTAYPIHATTPSTILYTTGTHAYDITFIGAPNKAITLEYAMDSEDSDNYDELGSVELILSSYQFRPTPKVLGVSWSIMTELVLGSTIDVDAESALIQGAAEEIKKALDWRACLQGYREAKKKTAVTFNADWRAMGSISSKLRAQDLWNVILRASSVIKNDIKRGGISKLYGGSDAVNYIQYHDDFVAEQNPIAIGVYKVGTLRGVDVFEVPDTTIVPADELVGVWKNDQNPNDVAMAIGTHVAFGETPKLTYKNMYSEKSVYCVEDSKVLQPKYFSRIQVSNIPTE
jgi:hypothetical protein